MPLRSNDWSILCFSQTSPFLIQVPPPSISRGQCRRQKPCKRQAASLSGGRLKLSIEGPVQHGLKQGFEALAAGGLGGAQLADFSCAFDEAIL